MIDSEVVEVLDDDDQGSDGARDGTQKSFVSDINESKRPFECPICFDKYTKSVFTTENKIHVAISICHIPHSA